MTIKFINNDRDRTFIMQLHHFLFQIALSRWIFFGCDCEMNIVIYIEVWFDSTLIFAADFQRQQIHTQKIEMQEKWQWFHWPVTINFFFNIENLHSYILFCVWISSVTDGPFQLDWLWPFFAKKKWENFYSLKLHPK